MSAPKPLSNDCFVLPQGVEWTPVRIALDRLRDGLATVVGTTRVPVGDSLGQITAEPVTAARSHPPFANSAIDGYGFSRATAGDGPYRLALASGRAAAGEPFTGTVPDSAALRILTGAAIPAGVDTVVLQEDVIIEDGHVIFASGLKAGANIRKAGEDLQGGADVLPAGRRITAGDIAVMASTGVRDVAVFKRLRVGILSTGDELAADGTTRDGGIYDANRPMLTALVSAWGYEPVDLGQARDSAADVRAALDYGAAHADVILTSGGASAGDEDHISALLTAEGRMETWRIALKPGRPLALGLWKGVPVFGLPGNPVAAFVCTLLFARPAMGLLSGGQWDEPQGFELAADFEKRKRQGRSEYLRARRTGEQVAAFKSEGSGRVSGLSWADGLVALDHEAGPVKRGDRVRFIPFSEFGL